MSYCGQSRREHQEIDLGLTATEEVPAHLVEYFSKLSLVLDGEEDLLSLGDVRKRVEVFLDDGRRAVKLETEIGETFCDGGHLGASDVTTDENTRLGLRNSETVGRGERSPVSFGESGSESSDFTSRGHLCRKSHTQDQLMSRAQIIRKAELTNTDERISTSETSP